MPTRISYAEIAREFLGSLPFRVKEAFRGRSDQSFVQCVLWVFQIPLDAYRLGLTKLFFRVGKLALLEKILLADFEKDGLSRHLSVSLI